jgi:hypothetical protein
MMKLRESDYGVTSEQVTGLPVPTIAKDRCGWCQLVGSSTSMLEIVRESSKVDKRQLAVSVGKVGADELGRERCRQLLAGNI